ncbi:hypothetical protein Ava_2815 [Trichormus variabilis ATCC 29413]|uniref:Uncharacterized protein n=2 Tax=Anabaena variabilis TaxID=264691 RepID=Q3M9A8_TRIV2|nr:MULTISPECIES: hypothetical protein [Nostocaceae]ABA22428.1 hypothetical protein Ava_2815 [Trichormus variabilis ATCC 29413]MBC1215255.1 hypothetical protein [Trichormus variabilis ARAD]MBC1256660.1 hypothetical protein [Trichormus variabilis V5]MBC1267191.1 hypothetical protein [Trichormus variabilis FSR]MBC1303296.1 hypothetical protein [Trichormus variabilis N2B]
MLQKYSAWIHEALSTQTFYGTPAILSSQNVLSQNLLEYPTLYEEEVIKTALEKYKKKQRLEGVLLKAYTTIIGGFLGFSNSYDGMFSANEIQGLFQGAGSGFAGGGLLESVVNMFDKNQLAELNLSWLKTRESYDFHVKSHGGEATNRLLQICWNKEQERHQTIFGIQFPDNYVAKLYPTYQLSIQRYLNEIGYSCDRNTFAVSDIGESCEWVTSKDILGYYAADNGMEYPIELWHGKQQAIRLVVKYKKPHHSLY